MRVLYYSNGNSPHDWRFLDALATSGNEIAFLPLSQNPIARIPDGIIKLSFPRLKKPALFTWADLTHQFQQITRSFQPDVVHAGPVNGPAYIATLSGFTPLVTMSWGADILYWAERNKLIDLICRYTINRSTVFTGDCQSVCNKAAGYGFQRQRMFQFPWGVDLDHFNPNGGAKLRDELGWQENFIFLSNRSMEPIYGVDVTVKSFIEIEKQQPDSRLLLYGRGSQEKLTHKLVEAAGIQDKVYFGGYAGLEELPGIYCSADVYLSASHCDGSSVSLLEALACGLPVIVSDIPSNLEWVQEGVNGWVFRDNSTTDMAQKMQDAILSPQRMEFAVTNRKLAEEKADWKRNFPVLLQAYEMALSIEAGNQTKPEKSI